MSRWLLGVARQQKRAEVRFLLQISAAKMRRDYIFTAIYAVKMRESGDFAAETALMRSKESSYPHFCCIKTQQNQPSRLFLLRCIHRHLKADSFQMMELLVHAILLTKAGRKKKRTQLLGGAAAKRADGFWGVARQQKGADGFVGRAAAKRSKSVFFTANRRSKNAQRLHFYCNLCSKNERKRRFCCGNDPSLQQTGSLIQILLQKTAAKSALRYHFTALFSKADYLPRDRSLIPDR